MKYVQELGLQNVRDIAKMLRWNEKYGIRFMRLSSEMFPFASHETYGYSLNDFACEALEEAGRVAGELGHRLSTHPGQVSFGLAVL
jgi:UV DNA damage endonuclease